MSGSVALNATSFLRLNGGAGFSNSSFGNAGRYAYNYTVAPVSYGLSWAGKCVMYGFAWFGDAFTKLITTGHIRTHLNWNDFWPNMTYGKYQLKYRPEYNSLSYGGGGQFLVPGMKFSPAVGLHWAHIEASKGNPYGITDNTGHLYYSGGLDYQDPSGFNFGLGYNYCPRLNSFACGISGALGFFF